MLMAGRTFGLLFAPISIIKPLWKASSIPHSVKSNGEDEKIK